MLTAAFGAGFLAGLGVVVPLGAMGVMLLTEGSARGWRDSTPAAFGVAVADLLYCAVALVAGSALAPYVTKWGKWPAAVGGVLLIALAVLMVRRVREGAYIGDSGRKDTTTTSLARFGLFFGLTLVNPFPLLYFGAITVGLGEKLHQPPGALLFALGVGVASAGWNLGLISAGATLRARSTARVQRIAGIAGSCIVGVCGVAVLLVAFLK